MIEETEERKIYVLKKQIASNRRSASDHKTAIKGLDEKLVGYVCELKDLEGK